VIDGGEGVEAPIHLFAGEVGGLVNYDSRRRYPFLVLVKRQRAGHHPVHVRPRQERVVSLVAARTALEEKELEVGPLSIEDLAAGGDESSLRGLPKAVSQADIRVAVLEPGHLPGDAACLREEGK